MKRLFLFVFCAMAIASYGCNNDYRGGSCEDISCISRLNLSDASRVVSLRSLNGGVSYGYGVFYPGSMVLVKANTRYSVSYSNSRLWKFMVRFNDGSAWYFD